MKKNGFTLIELLAVIIILCITITIVIVKVENNVKDAVDFGNDRQIESIESAALLYAQEYRNNLPNINEKKVDIVSLETLIKTGLLVEKDVEDISKTNIILIAEINNNIRVKYTRTEKNVIFLNGSSEISIYINDEYTEMGAYVAKPGIGIEELTSSNITSTINNSVVGEYKVTYSYENTESVERKVSVIN